MKECDPIVGEARRNRERREAGYREQALKLYPWVCGRCTREFNREQLKMLTVHHRDHNHDHNPPDGSNWELLCLYCHDNEHSRQIGARATVGTTGRVARSQTSSPMFQPFANLKELLKGKS